MDIKSWIKQASNKLQQANIESARLDSLLLLEDTLGKSRSWVLAHEHEIIPSIHLSKLNTKIIQREKRYPLAYLINTREFYGRDFYVDSAVLVPRPESESIINLLLKLWPKDARLNTVIDIGTGSGILAITAKLELPKTTVIATDVSSAALEVAAKNAKLLKASVTFVEADLLKIKARGFSFNVIITNLPYVPDRLAVSPELDKEPYEALFSGEDGLDHYRKLWQQIGALPEKPLYVICESLEIQHEQMTSLAHSAGYKLKDSEALVQVFVMNQ